MKDAIFHANVGRAVDPVDVNEMRGGSQLQLHQGDKALPSGQNPGIGAEIAQKGKGFIEGRGGMVLKLGWNHRALHSNVRVDLLNVTLGLGKVNTI